MYDNEFHVLEINTISGSTFCFIVKEEIQFDVCSTFTAFDSKGESDGNITVNFKNVEIIDFSKKMNLQEAVKYMDEILNPKE